MSGTQLAKIIRQEWPNVSILLATGYSDRVPGEDIALPKLTEALSAGRTRSGNRAP